MGLRLLVVACLVGAAFAGPLQRDPQCATRCPSSSKFKYEPGKTYVYDYQGVNHIVVAGDKKQKAEISGQVEIHVKSKCELILRMQRVRLDQKSTQQEKADLIRQLETPLPFAFEDGRIENVCPSEEETQLSQNIKKGILSSFINTMDKLDKTQEMQEVDSLGECATKYTVERRQQKKIVIEKQKDLKSCTNRHSSVTSMISQDYKNTEAAIHTLPIFPQEKLTCKEIYEDQVLKSLQCKELSTLKPISDRDSIIQFEGQMELQLVRVKAAENLRLPSSVRKSTILYELHDDESNVEGHEQEVEERLRQMCSKNTETIDLTVSKDFIALVASVKRLSHESLASIYQALEDGRLCSSKKLTDLFLDTLPMAGTDAAVKLMVQMLLEQKVTGLKAKLWTASLALVSHPSQEAIQAVVPLVRQQKTHSVLLGVSAMVYRYCSNRNCENNQAVREIVSTLNEVLGRQCSFEDENEAVAVLKAFGNMGQVLQAEQNILACAKDNDKSIRVRLAAIEAFRRVNQKKPEELLRLYTDKQENFEVRIAAISSVLPNADREQIRAIKSVAEQEADEQVSAYSGSLIANLNKTSSPLKREIRQLLSEIRVQTPDVGFWENSKNIEMSLFNDALNIGGAVETDIIHATGSKIPRSIYTRFDVDLFDKHINIFEIGARAEGLEAAFRKLIGFGEQQVKKSKSWSLLKSSNEEDDSKTQASIFFRTMNTELLELSVDDLTSMGEMVKIADILNKISQEKSADFSHSFMFLNSKLVIPSVTGRSYSFGLTGSATVGLTASSKIDIVNLMSKQKNANVHAHFQPSVNVEIASTVGIHSEKPRPDVKIITRLHSESDIEAQFLVKDGHLGLIKVSMPSENVLLTRVSSDIVEIDADHQERRIHEQMQTKIDHCLDQLQKPLGLSVCGKWEVPRPFLSKTFPFVKGVGNVELAIRKTDASMKGFEVSFEIPKHKSQLMKYRAALDTPGSRIRRRFAADLQIQTPSRDERQFTLQIESPFRSASVAASGSITRKPHLIEGSIDIQAGSSQRYSIKASSPISESETQRVFRPSLQVSSPSTQPLKVDGTITLTKGRKQQISFDLKSNKPTRKPIVIKGTIVKDGKLGLSKTREWKLSTDIALRTPYVNMQILSSTEKQAKQAQTVATSLTVDYQRERSTKQTVKMVAKVQRSSSKVSSVAQFDSTEYPSSNFVATWNMQGKIRESLKNDITIKYGRNPERHYINVLQSSRMQEPQRGENRIAVKAPQFNIDSEVNVAYDVKMNSRLHAEVDLRYKEDKHIKAKMQLDNLSERPLKLRVKAELQTPSRRMSYQDELEEIDSNTYKGNAVVEWQANKKAEMQYKYQKKSDRSKIHHAIETSLRLPESRYPIKNQASIQVGNGYLGIEGRLNLDRKTEYSARASLNKRGTSHISVKLPEIEGNLKVVNDEEKKAADMDLKLNPSKNARHVIVSATLGLGNQKKFEAEIQLDADRSPENKFVVSSAYEMKSRNSFAASSKLQVLDKANIMVTASGDRALQGTYEVSFEGRLLNLPSIGFDIKHEMRPTKLDSTIKISKNQKQKLEIALRGDYLKTGKEYQLSTAASLKSLDNSFQNKRWVSKQSFSRSGSVFTLKSTAKLELSTSKVYESEMNYDLQPNMVLMKANLHTPHINYKKQSVGFSFRNSGSLIASSAVIELPNGKSISVTSDTNRKDSGLSSTLVISSPFNIIKNARAQISWENKKTQKSLKSALTINEEKLADAELSLTTSTKITEVTARVQSSLSPEIFAHIIIEKDRENFKYDAQISKDSKPLLSATISKQISNQQYSYALESKSKDKTLLNLKIAKDTSRDSVKHVLEAEAPQASIQMASEQKDRKSLTIQAKACQKSDTKSCYSVKAYHKALFNEESYRYYRKLTLDIERNSQNSNPQNVANVNIVASVMGNDYRSKFILETKEKKLGYEIQLHGRDNEEDHCSLESQIYLPQRTIRVAGSALHKQPSLLLNLEVLPDVTVPDRKLALELKKAADSREITAYVTMLYPGWEKAIELSGHIEKQDKSGKLQLDTSAIGGQVFVMEGGLEQHRQEHQTMQYKLYSEDKKVFVSAKLLKRVSREESEYSYEWSFQPTQGQMKEGKVLFKLSEKINGNPQKVELEIVSPRASSKMSGRVTWGKKLPSSLQAHFEADNERIAQIDIRVKDDCLTVDEQLKSKPFMKTQVCFGKKQGDKIKLVSVQSHYKRKQSLDFAIEVDQKQPQLAQIQMKWDQRDFQQALVEARQVASELRSRYISDEDVKSVQKMWRRVRQSLRDSKRQIRETLRRHSQTLKTQLSSSSIWDYLPIESLKEALRPIGESFKCMFEKSVEYIRTHILDVWYKIWRSAKNEVVDCMKKYCPRDSFCYEVASLLEHFEVRKVQNLASKKMRSLKLATSKLIDPEAIREWIESSAFGRKVRAAAQSIIDDLRHWGEVLEEKLKCGYEKFVDWFTHWIKRFEKDEDFKVLKELVQETKEKAVQTWDKREYLLKNAWNPLKQSLMEDYPRRWVNDRLQIQQFSPKDGTIQIQIHHPLEPKHVQVLQNAIQVIKNKVV